MLTAHVSTSVGWLGAVAAFLVLAVSGLNSRDAETVRAAYLGTELIARSIIVPLCLASLVTGVVLSLGTSWGLVRHHWLLAKLVITGVSTVLLTVHLRPIALLGEQVARHALTGGGLLQLRTQLVTTAGMALAALLVATALSIYKPKGTTGLGWLSRLEPRASQP